MYSWSRTENSWQTSHTFLGHHISEMLGKALAFPSHGSVTAFTAKVAFFSLEYNPPPPLFFFKTWRKQNPMESVVGWPRAHYTAHKLESIQGEILAGNGGNRPGSTWLFPFYNVIRYTCQILEQGSGLVVRDQMLLLSVVVYTHWNAHKSFEIIICKI